MNKAKTIPDEDSLVREATERYHRSCRRRGFEGPQPDKYLSTCDDGVVVLRNVNGVLARYPVRDDGRLGRTAANEGECRTRLTSGSDWMGPQNDRLARAEVEEEAARRGEVEAEVRRRWRECSEEIEGEVSGYAMGSYLHWVEDAERDYDDVNQMPERRRFRYATLREWAEAEEIDSYVEGTRYYPSYAADIAEYAEEMAERRLVREGDPEDLREALERSISDREWEWWGIETASILTA